MNKAKTMAPTPEAPITLGTTMRPAPLLEALVEVVLGELLDLTVVVVSGFDVLGDGKPVDDPLEGVEEPPVVTVPLISAATVALNVPVIPVRLFRYVSCDQDGIKNIRNPRKLGGERLGVASPVSSCEAIRCKAEETDARN
jgi:hypothetical protein